VPDPVRPNLIYVLAGVNGAGKSSVLGEDLVHRGGTFFNPDEETRVLLAANPGMSHADANATAWNIGTARLREAIDAGHDYNFETTLGGSTITRMLEEALALGQQVFMSYVGLDSMERHIARVRARVAAGGHDIPVQRIRERYHSSRLNLVRLVPQLTRLHVWDNSAEADPLTGRRPRPALVLETTGGRITAGVPPREVPQWAKPIVAAALRR